MTKTEMERLLEPFNDDIRILVKREGQPNMMLAPLRAEYKVKRGALRLRDGSLLEDGEGYLEVLC